MNKSVLSSEEISALVEGFGDRLGSTPRMSVDVPLQGDVLQADRMAMLDSAAISGGPLQEGLKDLDLIQQSFATAFGSALSSLTKSTVAVIAQAARALNCRDWTVELRKPLLAYSMRIPAAAIPCLLVFEEDWLRGSVELMLGGPGSTDGVDRRSDCSPVERAFASRMAALACQLYGRACAIDATKSIKCSCFEHQDGIYAYAMPDAAMVCCKLQLCADDIKGSAWIVFPTALLGPIIGRDNAILSRSTGAEKYANRRA